MTVVEDRALHPDGDTVRDHLRLLPLGLAQDLDEDG